MDSTPATSTAPSPPTEKIAALQAAVCQVVRGKSQVVELALVAALAGGHVLVEDVPGVGKTTLAYALAMAMGGSFKRIQFTSDMLPADLLGVNVLHQADSTFHFRPGPIFANIVLADEINRTTPRTQSALLEAMNEHSVTMDGVTHPLPQPFMVIATQNPFDYHGTFPLPDSQLDRFLIRLTMGYPDRETERAILRSGGLAKAHVTPVLDAPQVRALMARAAQVQVHPELEDYLLALIERTRQDNRLLRGASTRAAEALLRAVRALATVRGRSFVIPEDIRELAGPVLAHRIIPRGDSARGRTSAASDALREILWDIPAPR